MSHITQMPILRASLEDALILILYIAIQTGRGMHQDWIVQPGTCRNRTGFQCLQHETLLRCCKAEQPAVHQMSGINMVSMPWFFFQLVANAWQTAFTSGGQYSIPGKSCMFGLIIQQHKWGQDSRWCSESFRLFGLCDWLSWPSFSSQE